MTYALPSCITSGMPLLRKVFFYLFALVYLVICPWIILRMLGYDRDPRTHHWVKTGIIYISSNPPGATVFINGRGMPEKTPTIIRDLTPANYKVRMVAAGYEAWESDIPVVDRKATSVENILLIPNEWKIKALNSMPLSKLIPVPGSNYLLVSADDTAKNIFILRLNKDIEDSDNNPKLNVSELEPLFPEESIYAEGRVMRFFTVEPSPFLVVQLEFGEKQKYLWIDPRDKQVHIEDISDLLPQPPGKLYWEPNDEKNLFAFYPGVVNRINIKAKAIFPNIAEKDIPLDKKTITVFNTVAADQIYLINNGNTLLFRKGRDIFLTDQESFGRPRLIKLLRVKDHTDVYFAERTGKLLYIDPDSALLSSMEVLHHKPFIPKPIADTLRLQKLEQ